jgi:ribosome assembly protein YihI (activator of Der GTPase)
MKEVEHKKIAVDHCSDRQPNVLPTEMNKTEPNLDQPATNVKRNLESERMLNAFIHALPYAEKNTAHWVDHLGWLRKRIAELKTELGVSDE